MPTESLAGRRGDVAWFRGPGGAADGALHQDGPKRGADRVSRDWSGRLVGLRGRVVGRARLALSRLFLALLELFLLLGLLGTVALGALLLVVGLERHRSSCEIGRAHV